MFTRRFVPKKLALLASLWLVSIGTLPAAIYAQNPAVTINIDAGANRHPISPDIYGLAYPDAASIADLNLSVQRYGGNNTSRYNWQLNADNRGGDWYFESIGDDSPAPAARIDSFFSLGKSGGCQSLITIPTIDWIARIAANRDKLDSFSVAKYGAQAQTDTYWSDAGNGVLTDGQDVTGNDPNDANVPNSSAFEQGLVQHLVTTFGTAASGGLKYYILDNEPSIWFSTHRDVHPVGPKMDEIKSKILDYSAMIKSIDPTALVVAPEEWGWGGYLYSGYDQQYSAQHGYSSFPDKAANGGWDYLPWILDQLRQNDSATGTRSLDVFSVHYYPQSGEFGSDTSQQMDLLRNRSTRSLWDPNYVDESWINDTVQLIPRLKNWVNTYYPGTKIAITEYNWGAESDISGATAQADILGIFGREGLDLATRWTAPDSSTPTYKAIKMYRNYDGQGSGFGDTSVSDAVPNPDNLSSFAALRASDGALTVMLDNKVLSGSTSVTVNLANFAGTGAAQVWQLTSANAINRLADLAYSGNALNITLPQQSVTLLVLASSGSGGGAVSAPSGLAASASAGTVRLAWTNNDANQTGVYIERAPKKKGAFVRVGQVGPSISMFSESPGKGAYRYRVQAFNSATVSAYSNVVTVKVR